MDKLDADTKVELDENDALIEMGDVSEKTCGMLLGTFADTGLGVRIG